MVAKNSMKDQTGRKFGRLTVKSFVSKGVNSSRNIWLCVCDCGKEKEVSIHGLRTGQTKSCGCLANEVLVERNTTHGLSRKHPVEYKIWKDMRQRCSNKNRKDYPNYGGRGISVCPRWNDFNLFFLDMGKRPEGKTIDRIDVNGNYEPSNCRWASAKEQSRNKRNNHIMSNGLTLVENSEISGVAYKTLSYRVNHGYDFDMAMALKDYRLVQR